MTTSLKTAIRYSFNPLHWPTVILVLSVMLLIQLPRCCFKPFLSVFSWLVYLMFAKRIRVVQTNLKLCFPDLTQQQRNRLTKRFIVSTITTLFDTTYLYYHKLFNRLPYSVDGFEKIAPFLSQEKPIILATVHMNTTFLSGKFLQETFQKHIANVFQTQSNPWVRYFYERKQYQYFHPISKHNVRKMIQALEQRYPLIYLFDLNDTKGEHFIPFFDVPAATKTAICKISKLSDAVVIPYVCVKKSDKRYHLSFLDPLTAFPSEDPKQDLIALTQPFEAIIRAYPEQYLWTHRRFKTRPDGEPSLY